MFRRISTRVGAARAFTSTGVSSTFSTSQRLLNSNYQSFVTATVRQPAPEFSGKAVINGAIKPLSLQDYAGKYVVLLFYPMDFTFVCPTELIAFSDRHAEFEKLNAQVIAVSVDSEYSHLAWVNTPRKKGGLGEMKIPVLSDLTKQISTDYGVLIEESGVALRGLFVIDAKGVLRHITVNDLPVGRSVDEVLRVIEAFQFVEKNGEVCPANWKPGSASLNPAKANDYFEKNN